MSKQQQTPIILPRKASVLIVGAGFAGLSTAWWMERLGYSVTIVEIAPALRKGGTPVNIKEESIEVVRRMGLLEAIRSRSLPPRTLEARDEWGRIEHVMPAPSFAIDDPDEEYEIERDVLLDMLYDAVSSRVSLRFGQTVAHLEEDPDGITVTYDDGTTEVFALVFGCDGMRSTVRRLVFGAEQDYLVFLRKYGALTSVDYPLIAPNVTQIHTTMGRTLILNGYADRTELGLGFHADDELDYDRRDKGAQRKLIRERFADMGGRASDVLAALEADDTFYFDKICQVKMSHWSRGRVALVGDAAYCPSPFAGMGGSMAIIGAAALHDALQQCGDNATAAFCDYERVFRPFVDTVQEQALAFGTTMFAPGTPEALEARSRWLAEMS